MARSTLSSGSQRGRGADDRDGDGVADFRPGVLLRHRDLQSMVGNLPPRSWLVRRRAAALLARSQELLLDCGGQVRLQAFYSGANWVGAATAPQPQGNPNTRLAVLLHGWEGSAESGYVLSLGALLLQHGFDVVRLNLRDHGDTHGLNREIFHSCRLAEVVGAICALARRFADARLYLAGFSLGGNFLLRVAAEAAAPHSMSGVIAISPVLDPQLTMLALERRARTYGRYFIRRWTRSLRAKQRAWPAVHEFADILELADLRAMTAELVKRCTDFPSIDAYLQGYALTGARLAQLRVASTVLIAQDDPIIAAVDLTRLAPSPQLEIVRTRYGGHCGFMQHLWGPSFADRFVLSQFEGFEAAAATPCLPSQWATQTG